MILNISLPNCRLFLPVALTLLFASSIFAQSPSSSGKRYAILVGINDYADSSIVKLSTPRNDVADLGERLASSDWDKVFVLTDDLDYRNQDFPSRTNIDNRVSLLSDLARPEDTIFIFFSGHGISQDNNPFLLPVDASLNRLRDTSISVSSMVDSFKNRGLRRVILAVDACREQVSLTKGISVVGIAGSSQGNSAVSDAALSLFATKEGWYSYEDKNGRNGVFTRFLLSGIAGEADGSGPSGVIDGSVTFSELAAWLPDATGAYALDQGLRQQAVVYGGSGDSSVFDVTVSSLGLVKPVVRAKKADPSDPSKVENSSDSEVKTLLTSIKGQLNTAIVDSLREIDTSLASENAKTKKSDSKALDAKQEKPARSDSSKPVSSAENDGNGVNDVETNDSDKYKAAGWGILQIGLFTPLQIVPKSFVVFGPSVGIIQTSNVRMYGIQAALIANAGKMGGLQTGLICTADFVGGGQVGAIVNNAGTVYGLQAGFINHADKVYGLQVGFINNAKALYGAQLGFINVLGNRGLFGKFMFGLNVGF